MFDLSSAKTRLGVTDNSQDALITSVLDGALLMVENYLNRKLVLQQDTEILIVANAQSIQLHRYPVKASFTVDLKKDGATVDYRFIDHIAGIIKADHGCAFDGEYTVIYEGGYAPLPGPIEVVLWSLFDSMYRVLTSTTSSGGGARKIQVTGVGSIDFGADGASAGLDGAGITDGSMHAHILQPYFLHQT